MDAFLRIPIQFVPGNVSRCAYRRSVVQSQAWEYRTYYRERRLHDGAAEDWGESVEDALPALGAEGWELVAIVPRSSEGKLVHAGVTTDELWVFKRPAAILSSEAMVVVAQVEEPAVHESDPGESFVAPVGPPNAGRSVAGKNN